MNGRYTIEGNYEPQAGLNQIFGQMSDILHHHAPQKEPDYTSKGIHPMVSVEQAMRELAELLKNEANNGQ
jgi:hypothetical protein